MSALFFLDTETTGLGMNDEIWEIACIRRAEDGREDTLHLYVDHDEHLCARLPERFREDHYDRFLNHRAVSRTDAARQILDFVEGGGHVVGAVPNFDTERIARSARDHYTTLRKPNWHYHLIDVEVLAVGFLTAQRRLAEASGDREEAARLDALLARPYRSDDLAAELGVTITEEERHTALGDARWAMRIYDAVMGGVA